MVGARQLGVIIVVLASMVGTPGRGMQLAAAQETDEGGRLLELAERLLLAGRYSGPAGIGGVQETAQLLPGRLPGELPFDLPVPSGGRLLGSLVSTSPFNGTSVEVRIDAPGTPNGIQEFYARAMRERGWSPPPPGAPGGIVPGVFSSGGFQPPEQGVRLEPRSSTFCQEPNGAFLRIAAIPRADEPSDVRAAFRVPPTTQSTVAVFGSCAALPPFPPPGPGTIARGPDLVPRLNVPEGAVLGRRGGPTLVGGQVRAYGSEATITTDLTVPALETYFAAQLETYQWVRVSSGGDALLAWSLWRLPEQDEWQGTLIVMRDPTDDRRRSLMVRVDSGARFFESQPGTDGFAAARPPVSADLTANPSLIRELAERLLAEPMGDIPGSRPTATLLAGRLAPELPQDLPMPQGARLLGSVTRSRNDTRPSSEAILDVPASSREALRFFIDELPRAGWRAPPSAPLGGPSGFVSALTSLSATLCQEQTLLYLTFRIRPQADGSSDVSIMTGSPGALDAACWPPPVEPSLRSSFLQSPAAAIPPLMPPSGATLQAGPMSLGANSFQSGGAIVTAQSPPEIEAFYSEQLRAAGWTRRAGAASAPLAWSLWDVPGEGVWQGLLLVFDVTGEDRHALSLGVHQVASDDR